MTISQKHHKEKIIKDFIRILDRIKDEMEESLHYQLRKLQEETEESIKKYRQDNIQSYNDELTAIAELRKELEELA